jgi:hypothetical protein
MNVLVCGVPRSGTSWVAEVLSETDGARLVNEPDHPLTNPAGGTAVSSLGLHPVLIPGQSAEAYELIWDVTFAGGFPVNAATSRASRVLGLLPASVRDPLMSRTARLWRRVATPPQHVIAKTVAGVFSLEWIAERYGAQVVLTKRNLLSVIGSWMRLGFVPYAGVEDPIMLADHPVVRQEYVEPLGLEPVGPDAPRLERIAFHIGLLAAHLDRLSTIHGDWTVVDHEDFSSAPELHFRELCQRLGLAWSSRVTDRLSSGNAPGSGTATQRTASQLRDSWRRDLDAEQLGRVQAVLAKFGDGFPSILEALNASSDVVMATPSDAGAQNELPG